MWLTCVFASLPDWTHLCLVLPSSHRVYSPCVSALMLPVSCWTIMSAAQPHKQVFFLFISPGFWPSLCLFYLFFCLFTFVSTWAWSPAPALTAELKPVCLTHLCSFSEACFWVLVALAKSGFCWCSVCSTLFTHSKRSQTFVCNDGCFTPSTNAILVR